MYEQPVLMLYARPLLFDQLYNRVVSNPEIDSLATKLNFNGNLNK